MKTSLILAQVMLLALVAFSPRARAAANHAPAGADKAISLLEDHAYVLTVADFGFSDASDTPTNAFKAVVVAGVATPGTLKLSGIAVAVGQTVKVADITAGLLVFTPALNANGTGYPGFAFQVQDDGGTANGGSDTDPTANKITFDITAVNDAPSGANKTVTLLEDGSYTLLTGDFGFSDFADTPPNKFAAVIIASLPAAGSLTLTGATVTAGQTIAVADIVASKLVFTPVSNANGTGYASLTFQVQDNGGTANGSIDTDPTPNTITFDVTPVNDPPVAVDDHFTIAEDVPLSVLPATLTANDSDVDGDLLQVYSIANPSGGMLSYDGTYIIFTPTPNYFGPALFTYAISDGQGGSATATVNIDVTPVNDPPVNTLPSSPFAALEDTRVPITSVSVSDADETSGIATQKLAAVQLTVASGTLRVMLDPGASISAGANDSSTFKLGGTQAAINATLATLSYLGNNNFNGNVTLTMRSTDASGLFDQDTLTIAVAAVNDPPVAMDDHFTIAEDVPLKVLPDTLAANDSDIDGDPLQVYSIANPSGGTLSYDGTYIIFTPTPNYFGPALFTYAISDGQGGSASATVNIDVTATPISLTVTNGPSVNPFRFILRGHAGSVYSLQTSSNLSQWSTWRSITNVAGSTLVTDPSASNARVRFYRAQFVQ